jgi:hypothetical protein
VKVGKSKKQIIDQARAFQAAVAGRFPSVHQEEVLEEMDGYDACIRIEVPAEFSGSLAEILDLSVALSERVSDETGINISAVVVQKKEPVHG